MKITKSFFRSSGILCYFKKADIVLLLVFLLIGSGSLLAVKLDSQGADTVIISVDGSSYGSYPLNVDNVINVDTQYGHNTVVIRSGTVAVTESDCENHDCERFGAISSPVQYIMCLPHRMIVRISGNADIDAVLF